ncbi:MAG: primosomal replication protein N [Aquabacterium sp.]|nr:primosomal replication protein N [Aquabacterium sp.]
MNRLVLSAQVIERRATRYTPAGLPAADLTLRHESQLTEDGTARKVTVELRAIGIGSIAERLARLAVGEAAGFAGFLSAQRNGRGVLFHITEFEPSAPAPSGPSAPTDQ